MFTCDYSSSWSLKNGRLFDLTERLVMRKEFARNGYLPPMYFCFRVFGGLLPKGQPRDQCWLFLSLFSNPISHSNVTTLERSFFNQDFLRYLEAQAEKLSVSEFFLAQVNHVILNSNRFVEIMIRGFAAPLSKLSFDWLLLPKKLAMCEFKWCLSCLPFLYTLNY